MMRLQRLIPSPLKERLRSLRSGYRSVTARLRALPDFIIVGAQKAGTTSLYVYLGQHPQILPCYGKEVHFFDGGTDPEVDNFKKGETWYRSHFPVRRFMKPGQVTFEASPLYLFNPLVAERIAHLVPQARLIALLRNPTDRAISHYHHERSLGMEPLPMLEAFEAEDARLEGVVEAGAYESQAFMHHAYKRRGHYAEQLTNYLQYFNRDQILVLGSERFFADPSRTLQAIFAFVDVDGAFVPADLTPRNVAVGGAAVDTAVREYLHWYFASHNQKLYDLLGIDFGW